MLPPLDTPYDLVSNKRLGMKIVIRLLAVALAAMYRNRERIRDFLLTNGQTELVDLFDQVIDAITTFLDSVVVVVGD